MSSFGAPSSRDYGAPSTKKRKKSETVASSPQKASPKKASPAKTSPRKFRPKKFYSPKKRSSSSPRKEPVTAVSRETVDDGGAEGANFRASVSEKGSGSPAGGGGDSYYLANFKEVLSKCLLPSNPERHVISQQDAGLVEEFMRLEGMVHFFC